MSKKKNKKTSKSNRPFGTMAHGETGDVLDQIVDCYCESPTMREIEKIVKTDVHCQGELAIHHMFLFANIMSFIGTTINQKKLQVCIYLDEPSIDFGSVATLYSTTMSIYLARKRYLGLKGEGISTDDFSFETAIKNYILPVDAASMKSIMDKAECEATASLENLNLGKTEIVFLPWGLICNTFDNEKIFAKVLCCLDEDECYRVQWMDTWLLYVACFEITNRIYNNYFEKKKSTETDTKSVSEISSAPRQMTDQEHS